MLDVADFYSGLSGLVDRTVREDSLRADNRVRAHLDRTAGNAA